MNEIEAAIQNELQKIERQEQVRILYACESGSRAWGFESKDSDYDVRFIYTHAPEVYLRLDPPRDVIERPIVDDLDINGWDIYKALRLLRKSNPPLLEWLFSPIVYRESSTAIEEMRVLAREFYSAISLSQHYYHMANNNYHQYIEGKSEVILKKYLYVLRPLVARLFLEQNHQIPPTHFLNTLAQVHVNVDVDARIHTLVALKSAATELDKSEPDAVLNIFIEEQLHNEHQPVSSDRRQQELSQELEKLLARVLQ